MGRTWGFLWSCGFVASLSLFAISPARGQVEFSFDDLSTHRGLFATEVHVNGEQPVSSINVALSTMLVTGHPDSTLVITAFDPFSPKDSIWTDKPVQYAATPPGLPNTWAKLNHTIVSQTERVIPKGSVFGLTMDASNTRPGDVFQIDLNYSQRTTVADGGTFVTDLLFSGGTVTILSPSGDLNQDGQLDAIDINLLTAAVKEQSQNLDFDVNVDGLVNESDRDYWVNDLKKTYYGDANLDGEFNSRDFIVVLLAGEYEDDVEANSVWETGDWNGDCEFTSSDFVKALIEGGYEQGPRNQPMAAVAAVPEPTSGVLLLCALPLLNALRRSARISAGTR